MNSEMSKTPQPKNSCSECGKAIFNDGGKCIKCLSTPVKKWFMCFPQH